MIADENHGYAVEVGHSCLTTVSKCAASSLFPSFCQFKYGLTLSFRYGNRLIHKDLHPPSGLIQVGTFLALSL